MPPLLAALPAISAVASVAGGVVGAVGAVGSANAAATSAQTNANIQNYNAQVAERNRDAVEASATSDAQQKQRDNAKQLGAIRVAYGASGLSMAGSPLEQLGDTAMSMQQDSDRIIYKGDLAGAGYTDEAAVDRVQAGLDESSASYDGTAGYLGAGTSLLSGISNAGSTLIRNR